MQHVFEEHDIDPLPGRVVEQDWKVRFDRYVTRFEPVLGPQEGPPGRVARLP